ncbi:inducible alternative oxidase 2 [Recurvomyces mirabilis]|nr:inducible alternative oxidase 2 [Recurvomyces mirabilis]
MSRRISYTVEGDVQGVNYRSFAVKQANSLSITGHAKNMNNGTVAGEAQGSASAIDKFLQHLKMGPSAAKVKKVDHQEIDTKQGDSGFDR